MEHGETLQQAIVREMREETGLEVSIERLLYVADKPEEDLLHITFALSRDGGALRLPTNEFEVNPISDVRFVEVRDLTDYGFSGAWQKLVADTFSDAPKYVGHKANIGL